ncbi:TIGR04104 family putative zinc finger protein [Planococcus halotolerans]|uniref:Cxxc_20_cxxc protein n=1 Tax=Planococcus halotolerans TaxID=2233542 RepID=A0A365L1M2_9BACL|nr:TIGR04104 family putative zinc finger protein [Planococcus halotolerans]RAZ79273.1 hypothetical protein DP120_06560 [Planococcus halotolerans]
MPHCPNCNQKWNLKKTLKAHGEHNLGNACPNCKEVQYVSRKTKRLQGFITMGYIIITFLAWREFELAAVPFFTVAILTIVLGIFILISATELSQEVESGW